MATCDNATLVSDINRFKCNLNVVDEIVNSPESSINDCDGDLRTTITGWQQQIQAALDALAWQLEPLREGPVDLSTLTDGIFNFSEIQYVPGENQVWVIANGSKLELGADYTESSSTSITLTADFIAKSQPDTRIEAWTVDLLPNNQIKAEGVSYNGAYATVQQALDAALSVSGDYVTLEQFNAAAGTGNDDTAAFVAAAATGKIIQLLAGKTYLLEPQLFTTTPTYNVAGIVGGPGSTIAPFGPLKFPATDYCLLHVHLDDGGLLQGFTVDAKISQTTTPNVDPAPWTTSNYDTWYGSRGLVIRDSNDYHVDRVVSMNSYSAPLFTINSVNPRHTNNISIRSRGVYGDGYYNSSVTNLTEDNCIAIDGTRIGFVTEAFTAADIISSRVTRTRCYAENFHDSSANLGVVNGEFNAGFWDEHSGWVLNEGCHFKNVGNRGFVASMVASPTQQTNMNGATAIPFQYVECSGDGAEDFITSSSQQSAFEHYTRIENCHGINIRYRFAQLGGHLRPKEQHVIKQCSVRLSPVVGAVIQAGVLCQGGEVEIDDFTVYYEGRNMTDYLSTTNASKTVSHFGTRGSTKVVVNNLRVYDETNTRIPGTVCFRDPELGCKLTVTDSWLQGIDNRCTETHYDNCTLDPLSTERSIFRMTNCVVKSIAGGVGDFRTIFILDGQTRCEIFDTLFDLRVWSNYLHLFNSSKITSSGLAKVHRCKFMWDAATNGHVIQLNAASGLKATNNDIYNFEISSCEFENTGGATSNAILRGEFGLVNNAKVYGAANYKSSNLSTLVSGNIQSNWSVKNFGAA